eukprot:scaffold52335_cov61-Phaeocystis_antarctica.AAC.4
MGCASPPRSTRPRRTRTGCQAWPCRAAVACTACTETSRDRSNLVPSSLPKRERARPLLLLLCRAARGCAHAGRCAPWWKCSVPLW